MGKNKNKNKNKSTFAFDSDEEDNKNVPAVVGDFDDSDFQPVKKGAKINMFQMLKQDESDSEENVEKGKDSKVNLATNKVNLATNKDNDSFVEVLSEKGNTETESLEEVLSEKLNQNVSNTQLFKLAYEEDAKGNQLKAIEYYTILVERSHKVSMHNLAHIYWEQNKLEMALTLFERAIKLKYLNSFYDYAVLVSDNLNKFSKYKTKAMEYFKTYMILKNATQSEKEIYFDLFDF